MHKHLKHTKDWLGDLLIRKVEPVNADPTRPCWIMVHGGGQGGWVFERWQKLAAHSGWTTLAVTLPGHEPTHPLPIEQYCLLTLFDYRDAVETAINTLELHAPILLGHSLGGMVCQCVAERQPVRGLVLLSSAGPAQLGARRPLLPADIPVSRSAEEARQRYFHSANEETIRQTLARLVPESPSALNTSGGRYAISLGKVDCPVLAIHGREDRTDVPSADSLASLYAGTAIELAQTGHNIMQEQSGDYAFQCIEHWCRTMLAA